MTEIPKELEEKVMAFRADYEAACEKYGMSLCSCGCCGGLSLWIHEPGKFYYGESDPNDWAGTGMMNGDRYIFTSCQHGIL